jgi:DNA-binding winged helix-turn-helix (wHTH) protein/Tol biopolymer transport system component
MSEEICRPGGSIRSRDSLFVAKETTDRDRRELYEFGCFRLEPAERKLMRGNEVVVLTPKAFETLVLLVRNNGHLLEKDELLRTLWPNSFVEEGNLSNNIFVLRKALGEDHPFIETVPKRGYRFVGAVRQLPIAEKALRERRDFASERSTDRRSPEQTVTGAVPSAIRSRRKLAALAATASAILAIGAALLWRSAAHLPDRSQWVQLTRFPDSVSEPALSPDGRMLAFIRGYGFGQVYVKILPDGEPVQLAYDDLLKTDPTFSPDGSRVAYTTLDPQQFDWDTWVVPTLGGEPQRLLRNASGLVWTGPHRVLFSEVKAGRIHMGIVAADESRLGERDVYLPTDKPAMAHRSHLSPDGKWVLLVEMDQDHLWLPCRLVPMDGSTLGRHVGPLGGGCTFAAWSRDGKWMYFTANPGGAHHIWRQRFPDGEPEQFTSGPTEEEGIAMAPDGHSLVTAVAVQNSSLWIHNSEGERQISLEGNGTNPKFTPDGKTLCYLIAKEAANKFAWYRNPGELRMADLKTGRSEPVARGLEVLDYDISADGRQVVTWTTDSEGRSRLWLATFDHGSPPLEIPSVEGAQPRFGPDGEILFRQGEFVYRVHPDGTRLRKAFPEPVYVLWDVSPDGKWIVGWAPRPGNGPPAMQAFPLDGGSPVQIGGGFTFLSWSRDGRSVLLAGSYLVQLPVGESLPPIPKGGFHSDEEIAHLPGAHRIDAGGVVPGPSADVYAFYRGTIQRNLYRIPIP